MAIIRPKFFYPLVINTSNRGIVINVGAGDVTVNIATGTYASAEALRAAVETAVQTVSATMRVYLSVYRRQADASFYATDRSGRFIFDNDDAGVSFSLKAGDVAFTSYLVLGFFALTYTSSQQSFSAQRAGGGLQAVASDFIVAAPHQHMNGWYPEGPAERDSLPIRDRSMDVMTRAVAGQTKTVLETELGEREWRWSFVEGRKVYRDFEGSSNPNESFERLWDTGYDKFRFFPDELSEGSYVDYSLTMEGIRRFEPGRQFVRRGLYQFTMNAWKYVA